jgi:HK97 family phage portal protein
MNIFSRAKLLFSNKNWDRFIQQFMSGEDDTPGGNAVDVSGNNALKFNAVFACVRVLGETFASVPADEYKKDLKSNDREATDDTGLRDLFKYAPNSEMSAFNFKEMGMAQINLGGNFYCIRANSSLDKTVQLNPIEWDRVDVTRDDSNRLIYKVRDSKNPANTKLYRRGEMFHIPGPSTNGIVGMSPVEYACEAIRLGKTYEQFSNKFFKNGAFPSGIFKHPGWLKEEAFARLKKELAENLQGMLNTGKPILAEDGLDFVPMAIKLVDAELLTSRRFSVEEICRIYRVPLHLVQELTKSSFSNIEHQSLEFVMYTMLPWFKRWEECINSQLLSPSQRKQGYYFEFNMAGLLRGDQKSMSEAFAQGRQWGWLSVNDIRRLLNMNGIGPSGDIYLQPMNMVKAGTEIAPKPDKQLVDEIKNLIDTRR